MRRLIFNVILGIFAATLVRACDSFEDIKNKTIRENYELLCYSKWGSDSYDTTVVRSKRTGLTLVYMCPSYNSSISNFNVVIGTPIQNNFGIPHALEHISLTTTDEFPEYRRLFAYHIMRNFASNKDWATGPKLTDFYYTSVGKSAITVAEVILKGLIFQHFTEPDYKTAIHNINDKGVDSSPLYREIYANQEFSHLVGEYERMGKNAFPGDNNNWLDAGGKYDEVINNLNVERIAEYHKKYYNIANLNLILEGSFGLEVYLSRMYDFESSILPKLNKNDFYKAFSDLNMPKLNETKDITVEYRELTNSKPCINFFYDGPAITEQIKIMEHTVLHQYIVTALARYPFPPGNNYVTYVDSYDEEYVRHFYMIGLEEVKKENMDKVKEMYFDFLRNASMPNGAMTQNDINDAFISAKEVHSGEDTMIYDKYRLTLHNQLVFPPLVCEEFEKSGNHLRVLEELQKKPLSHWQGKLKEYFLDAPYVMTRSFPSREKQEQWLKEEKERIQKRVDTIGLDKLKEDFENSKTAAFSNIVDVPTEVIETVPLGDTDSVYYPDYQIYTNIENYVHADVKSLDEIGLERIPIKLAVMDTYRITAQLVASLDMRLLPDHLNKYALLLSGIVGENLKKGPFFSVNSGVGLSTGGTRYYESPYADGDGAYQIIHAMQIPYEDYAKGVSHLSDVLFKIPITKEGILNTINKILTNSVFKNSAEYTRDMTFHLTRIQLLKEGSTSREIIPMRQKKFMNLVQAALVDTNNLKGQEKIINDLQEGVKALTDLNVITVVNLLNLTKCQELNMDIITPWRKFAYRQKDRIPDFKVYPRFTNDNYKEKLDNTKHGYIYPSIKAGGSNLCIMKEGARGFQDPKYVSDLVTQNLFSKEMAPMFNNFRLGGLTYRYNVFYKNSDSIIFVGKGVDAALSYKTIREVLSEVLNGSYPVPAGAILDSYKAAAFGDTIFSKSQLDLKMASAIFNNLSPTFWRGDIQKRILSVNSDRVKEYIFEEYQDFIDGTNVKFGLIALPSDVQKLQKDFKEMNINLEIIEDLEKSPVADIQLDL